MKAMQYLSEENLVEQALVALMKALGPVETMRFLNLPPKPRLESVERHRKWQATTKKIFLIKYLAHIITIIAPQGKINVTKLHR